MAVVLKLKKLTKKTLDQSESQLRRNHSIDFQSKLIDWQLYGWS